MNVEERNEGDFLELTLDEPSGVTMAFRYIPACPEGFLMGSRNGNNFQPVHRVVLTEGFWAGRNVGDPGTICGLDGIGDLSCLVGSNQGQTF